MLQKIGFLTICIGAMCADTDNLLIPIGIVLIGAVLLKIGEKLEGRHKSEIKIN